MNTPVVELLDSWPQPSTSPGAIVFATETQLFLRYSTADDETAVIQFPLVKTFQFGSPNDEALGGHPLTKFGLKYYRVHRIVNSPWIAELEQRNSIHPRHDKERFLKDIVHYVFTFQDSTLECVVNEGQFWSPKIQVLSSDEEAKSVWSQLVSEASA
ncbi:hypothetical protein [Chitinimonas taiwanensis]|uniref:hypothetical protein n=1 Tax=Chitinimonas taiwanensis TaxID=240412 RepID=UPI0035AE6BDA